MDDPEKDAIHKAFQRTLASRPEMEEWELAGEVLMAGMRVRKCGPKPIFDSSSASEFELAVVNYVIGNELPLQTYLCEHHPLSPEEQAGVVWAMGERVHPERWRPRLPDLRRENLKTLARVAIIMFQGWRNVNTDRGTADRGHREEMKQRCCEFVVGLYGGDPGTDVTAGDIEAVRDLMDRPASRRKQRN